MDGKGGCCIARYGGGTYDISSVDRIMMRFRPIAPKPANTASASVASSPEISEKSTRSGRGKRRLSSTNGNDNTNRRCNIGSNNNRKRKGSSEEKIEAVVTLPLFPETPDEKDTPERSSMTLPCDVWRMDGGGGGFAWRLDVKAALSLGR